MSKLKKADMTRKLPAEMMLRIFRLLPPRTLKIVVLVCRRLRELGEDPVLCHCESVLYAGDAEQQETAGSEETDHPDSSDRGGDAVSDETPRTEETEDITDDVKKARISLLCIQ